MQSSLWDVLNHNFQPIVQFLTHADFNRLILIVGVLTVCYILWQRKSSNNVVVKGDKNVTGSDNNVSNH